MRPALRAIGLTLLVGGLLAGCATGGSTKGGASDSPAREAARVNTSLGQEYMQRGQYEIAMEKLDRAIDADASYAPAHTVKAVLYERLGMDREAGEAYRRAVRAAPDNGEVNNNYGAYLCRSGRAEDAERHFLKAVEDPFYRTPEVAYANAGSCVLREGELDKAETYLRQSLEFDAQFADALLAMATLSYREESFLRARAFLQRFEAASPPTAESLSLGFRIESALGDAETANRYADELKDRFPDEARIGGNRPETGS